MLKMNIIQESRSTYSSPIVIVKKRDGTNRLCVDFRKLNKITEVDPEPTNTVAETIQNLSTDRWFSKIDLTKGYWQVPLAKEDVHKTTFFARWIVRIFENAIWDGKLWCDPDESNEDSA